jgi:hypothetical protein
VSDTAIFCVIVASFAALVTVHLTIVFGLFRKPPRWRAVVALVAPPLAPYFALRDGQRFRGAAFIGLFAVYVVALLLQSKD